MNQGASVELELGFSHGFSLPHPNASGVGLASLLYAYVFGYFLCLFVIDQYALIIKLE